MKHMKILKNKNKKTFIPSVRAGIQRTATATNTDNMILFPRKEV